MQHEDNAVGDISFSGDGQRLAMVSLQASSLTVWDVPARRWIATIRISHSAPDAFQGPVAFVPNEMLVATVHSDESVRLFAADSLARVAVLKPPVPESTRLQAAYMPIAISGDGKLLAVPQANYGKKGRKDKKSWNLSRIKLFDLPGRTERGQLERTSDAWSMSFSHEGTMLAVGVANTTQRRRLDGILPAGTVEIWDLKSMKLLYSWPVLTGCPLLQFSPTANVLAISSGGEFRVWDVTRDGPQELELRGSVAWGYATHEHAEIGFSPDGRWLATVSADERGVVKICDTKYGALRAEARGPQENYTLHVAFSPDGEYLATSSMLPHIRPKSPQLEHAPVLLWKLPSELRSTKAATTPSYRPAAPGDSDQP